MKSMKNLISDKIRGQSIDTAEPPSISPAATDYEPHPLTDAGFEASANALSTLTIDAQDHSIPPKSHIHASSTDTASHAWLSKFLPASTLASVENKFHLGNYVLDRKTGEKTFEAMSIYVRVGMHLLYYGSEQEKMLHWQRTLALLKTQSEKMGREYDSPESKAHIIPFIQSFELADSLDDMVQPDPAAYPNFNAFFAREIKESARPIAEPENDLVTSSVADCRLTAFPTIDLATKYWIKGFGFTLDRLLGDAQLASQFDGGSLVIARLAPQDYHRWHAPVSGTVKSIVDIPGAYYTVNPQAINEPGTLDVFCENKRSVMIVERSSTGSPIAIVAVGAMLVGSIKYVEGVNVGAQVRRGQCLGAFYYGGSTVITLYPPGEVVLDEDLVKNSTGLNMETYMQVGWSTGIKP
ncbi:Phosphatidylserine decarboxylase 3 alpha chain [Hyphodiscus hymeniophilus]|uniref:Phosphatidylserine decarboxylase 3 alpha chain n=1 Tax=Hyphodiscus hymeniophilus TaxID=353542 RepID=A0A9P6SPH1_9HELO|nr:Phosphatidylserine decarboxylase 3 alpha chain [Hyphodiscus hymeniophilus]